MTPRTDSSQAVPVRRLNTVVVVSRNLDQDLFDTVLDAVDYDVVLVEALPTAYTHIKRVSPSLVILCLSIEDREAANLMSMLTLDRETAAIPLVVHASVADDGAADCGCDEIPFRNTRMSVN